MARRQGPKYRPSIETQQTGELTLISHDSPVEALSLPTRALHLLRQLGCETVGDVLREDFTRSVRHFGPTTRESIAVALVKHGFEPPASLRQEQVNSSEITAVGSEVAALHSALNRMTNSFRNSLRRIERSLAKLSGGG